MPCRYPIVFARAPWQRERTHIHGGPGNVAGKLSGAAYKAMNVFGISLTAFSAVFGVTTYFVGISTQVSVAWVFIFFSIPCVLFFTAIDVIKWLLTDLEPSLPRIAKFPAASLGRDRSVVLVEPSKLFGQNMLASIFYMDDGFEILIGDGYVLTVQQDQKIQVSITYTVEGTEVYWEGIRANKAHYLGSTIIRPGGQRTEI